MASGEQTIHSELRDMIGEVFKKLDSVSEGMMSKLEAVSADVKHLSYRVAMVEQHVESLKGGQNDLSDQASRGQVHQRQQMEQVHQSITAAVSFNTFLNIMFYGITSHHGMSPDAVFRRFMVEMLRVEQGRADSMPIHVQYLPIMSQIDVHPPICVTFRSNKDREHIKQRTVGHQNTLQKAGIMVKSSYLTRDGVRLWKCK